MARPDQAELARVVARMEGNLAARGEAAPLLAAYRRLVARFEADLDDPRDVLLSRGGALMLVQALADGRQDW
jgi:hypothetical protein